MKSSVLKWVCLLMKNLYPLMWLLVFLVENVEKSNLFESFTSNFTNLPKTVTHMALA